MKSHIVPALKMTILCLVFFSGFYTLIVWGFAKVVAPAKGNAETVSVDGKIVGAKLVAQEFTQDKYFQSRPSAVQYNGGGSAGSNKGPSNPDYLKTVQERIDTFLAHNPTVKKESIPAELVTASGSGLDPHISPAAALIQADRIAKAKHISKEKVVRLIEEYTEGPLWGVFGTPTINVLKINIALDQLK